MPVMVDGAELATVQDLWELSDALGVPACTILASAQQFVRGDAEDVSDRDEPVKGKVGLAV